MFIKSVPTHFLIIRIVFADLSHVSCWASSGSFGEHGWLPVVGERGRWLSTLSYNLTVRGYSGKEAITDFLSPSEASPRLSWLLFYSSRNPTFGLRKCFSDRKCRSDHRTSPCAHTGGLRWRQAGPGPWLLLWHQRLSDLLHARAGGCLHTRSTMLGQVAPTVHTSFQHRIQWQNVGSLKLTMVGAFTSQKSANTTHKGLFPLRTGCWTFIRARLNIPHFFLPVWIHFSSSLLLQKYTTMNMLYGTLCTYVCISLGYIPGSGLF